MPPPLDRPATFPTMRFSHLPLLLLLLGAGTPTLAPAQVEIQLFTGSALSLPLPMTVSQDGYPDVRFTARWATRPSRPTWYYAWRVGVWKRDRGWRLDHTHHKIYLLNNPAEVDTFRITNGFNIVTVSRAFRHRNLTASIGAGPVVTYPISTVRGKKFDHDSGLHGYHLSGGSLMLMATREFPLVEGLVLSLDARGSLSYVSVPIVDGHAHVPNAALHLHAGLGYVFGR